MTSVESEDGMNSLFMKRPVGTLIFLLSAGILTTTGWAIIMKTKRQSQGHVPRS